MKTLPITQIGEDDLLFQRFLKSCNSQEEPCNSTQVYRSTVDRFSMSGLQFEKQKGMSKYKQRKLQRNSGFIEASKIEGNVGDQSLDDLLCFINGAEKDVAADDKTTSLKVKTNSQQQNVVHLKIPPKAIGEKRPHFFNDPVSCDKTSEIGFTNLVEHENGFDAIDNDSKPSNIPPKVNTIPEVVAVVDIFDNMAGKFEPKEIAKSRSEIESVVFTNKKPDNFINEVGVEGENASDTSVEFLGQEIDLDDAAEFSLVSFPGFPDRVENGESSESENNQTGQADQFIVVQKKKRNRAGENRNGKESSNTVTLETGSKTPIPSGRKNGDTLSKLLLAKPRNSKFSTFNRNHFHQPWSDVYRDKNRRRSDLMLKSSGSENSSTCSAPILKRVAPCFVSDELNVKNADAKNPEIISNSEFDKLNPDCISKICDSSNNHPVAEIRELNSGDPVAMVTRIRKNPSVASELDSAIICSENSSLNTVSRLPVIFLDTRRKLLHGSYAEKIDVSFGFDSDDVITSRHDNSSDVLDNTGVPIASNRQIPYSTNPVFVSGYCDCCCCMPYASQIFEDSLKSGTSVISLPNQLCQTVMSVAYSTFNSFPASHYALPVSIPVGIVPPFILNDYRQANSMSPDFTTFENENSAMVSSKLPDISTPGAPVIQVSEDEMDPHSTDVDAQLSYAFSKSKRSNVFSRDFAQRFLHSQFEDVISHCSQLNPNNEESHSSVISI